jgi:hypothetical protein
MMVSARKIARRILLTRYRNKLPFFHIKYD